MSQNVSVIVTAKDLASGSIRRIGKELDGLSKKVSFFGKAAIAAFGMGELKELLKKGAEAAAEQDKEIAKTMKSVSNTFYSAQVAIGKAMLGNKGVVWVLKEFATGLAMFVTDPLKVMRSAFFGLVAGIGIGVGKLMVLMSRIPGLKSWGAAGESLQAAAYMGLSIEAERLAAIKPTQYTKPTKGGSASRAAPLDMGGYAGGLQRQVDAAIAGFGEGYKGRLPKSFWAAMLPEPTDLSSTLQDAFDAAVADLSLTLPDAVRRGVEWQQLSQEFAMALNETFARAIGDGLTQAFDTLFQTGRIDQAIGAFFGSMLSAIGVGMQQVGAAMVTWGIAVKLFKDSLWADPTKAIAAGLGLIAVGAALKAVGGVVGNALNGGSRAVSGSVGRSGATLTGGTEAFSERGTVVIEVPRDAMVRPSDPVWQDFLRDSVAAAQGRRLVFRTR